VEMAFDDLCQRFDTFLPGNARKAIGIAGSEVPPR